MLTLRLPFSGKSKGRRKKRRKSSKREIISKRMWMMGFAASTVAIVMLLTAPIIYGYFTQSAQASLAPSINLSDVKATPVTNKQGYVHGTGVLTERQLRDLARISPALHGRILKAVGENKPVIVSHQEGRVLATLTERSNQEIKAAGVDAAIVSAVIITLVYLVRAYAELKKNPDPNRLIEQTPDNILVAFLNALACIFFQACPPQAATKTG